MRIEYGNRYLGSVVQEIVKGFEKVATELTVEYGSLIAVETSKGSSGFIERIYFQWNDQEFEDARTLRKHLNNQAFL